MNIKIKTQQSDDHICDKVFLRSLRKEKVGITNLAEVIGHRSKVFEKFLTMVNQEAEDEFSDDDPEVCHLEFL